MRPVPGNHEYMTADARGYFDYFGSHAGTPGSGYYSFNFGAWHLIALHSERDIREGGRQFQWLRADIASTTQRCVLAYWNRPRFTAGEYTDCEELAPFWSTLTSAGAVVVLSGHDHNYQRYALLGAFDAGGMRQFVVAAYRVLRLTLRPDGYDWAFLATASTNYLDNGHGECR